MNRKGFIWLIILIVLPLISFYLIKTNFSKIPNEKSKKLASTIRPYSNAKSWQTTNNSRICIFYVNKCKKAPSLITFSSDDEWAEVYKFYRDNLISKGWQTNSHIVTSIPSSLVIGNDTYFEDSVCEAVIRENKNNYLGLLDAEETDSFTISVSCFID